MSELMEKSHLGLSVPRSLNLCIMFAMDLCICSHLVQEEASLMIAEHFDLFLEWTFLNFIDSSVIHLL